MTNKSNDSFFKQLFRAITGAIVLIALLLIWYFWDQIYHIFYTNIAPTAPKGSLLIFWLLFVFPLLAMGVALLFSGGYHAYKIATPEKETEE